MIFQIDRLKLHMHFVLNALCIDSLESVFFWLHFWNWWLMTRDSWLVKCFLHVMHASCWLIRQNIDWKKICHEWKIFMSAFMIFWHFEFAIIKIHQIWKNLSKTNLMQIIIIKSTWLLTKWLCKNSKKR